MVGMASPRFAVYISVPGAAMGLGSGMGLVASGTVALTACSCDALAGDDAAAVGFAVWASAVKLEEEREPMCHAAPAKIRQETPVMMRTDETRKVPPRKPTQLRY